MKTFKQHLVEFSSNLNMASISLDEARTYSENKFSSAKKDLNTELPDFNKNFNLIKQAVKQAPDIPRIDMPVIEPKNMDQFQKDLKAGRVDIFKPFTFKHEFFPKDLHGGAKSKEFLHLGMDDGNKTDDIVKATMKKIKVSKLKPTQSQIWLEKVIDNIVKWGTPTEGSQVTTQTIIVSKDGFILDGHHRYGQAMMANPNLKMTALYVPLNIDLLLKMGRSYGNAVGNKQKK